MMDFDNVLSLATQNRGDSSVQKRYSLQTGPPKKDPKSKGVSSAAIQALLKKKQIENKMKVIERKKQKEELLAKRVEKKTDRKARAMASRTKDNFHGYNGVPIVELPKKRRTKQEMEESRANSNTFRNNVGDPDNDDDEDNYEYDPSESEEEQEPRQNTFNNGSFKIPIKQNTAPKSAAPFNFAALLKLAEKKQHEPVELKPKIVKKEGRLRTADEIRELELERKAKKLDVKGERSSKDHSSSNSSKTTLEKNNRLQKSKPSGPVDKQMQRPEKNNPSFKSSVNDRDKLNSSHKEKVRVKQHSSSSTSYDSSRPTHSQVSSKQMGTKSSSNHKTSASNDLGSKKDNSLPLKRKSVEPPDSRASSSTSISHKNQLEKRESQRPGMNVNIKSNVLSKPGTSSSTKPGHPQPRPGGPPPQPKSGVRPGASGVRAPSVGQSRPSNGGPAPGRAADSGGAGTPKCTVVSETISSKNMVGSKAGVPPRPGMPSQQRPGILQQQRPGMSQQRPGMSQQRPGMSQQQQQRPGMAQQRPGMSQQQRPGMSQQQRPGMSQQQRPGMSQQQRPGMSQQQRPGMSQQQRPGMSQQQRPGMSQQQRPGIPPRPMNRPPGPMLPPITSAYKRKFEDEEDEYDSEMDDFIDDGDDDQESISQHIKQIFGYDRNKYKDESDYALRFMESSWKDMQKEEARSLRMAVQEDLEEERKEEEEFKRQNAKKPRKK